MNNLDLEAIEKTLASKRILWELHPQKNSFRYAYTFVKKFYSFFDNMIVVDPFAGVGTLLIAVYKGAKPKKLIAIELEPKYVRWGKMYEKYMLGKNIIEWHCGDAVELIDRIGEFDVIFTSPPSPMNPQAKVLFGVIRDAAEALKISEKDVRKILAPEIKKNVMGDYEACFRVTNTVLRKARKYAKFIILANQVKGYIPFKSQDYVLIHKEHITVRSQVSKLAGSYYEIYVRVDRILDALHKLSQHNLQQFL